MPGKNVYVNLQDVCATFYFIYICTLKIIIDLQCVHQDYLLKLQMT